MLKIADGAEELGYLFAAEDHRELLRLLREGDVVNHPRFTQAHLVEKTQGADGLIELGPGGLLRLEEEKLKLRDLLRPQLIRRLAEVLGEFGYPVHVDLNGPRRVVADLEIAVRKALYLAA